MKAPVLALFLSAAWVHDAPATPAPPADSMRTSFLADPATTHHGGNNSMPSDVQTDAPSINDASPDLLDRAGVPALGGIAWDERMRSGVNQRAITFGVTPLAVARALRLGPAAAGAAGSAGLLDRVAARVTMGGPLQAIDPRKAAAAGRLTSHITSELKLALTGAPPAAATGATRLALAMVADNLATGYGLDRYGATLIAERPGAHTWTANAGYRLVERYHAPVRLAETKLGAGVAWRLFGGRRDLLPVDVGLSGGCVLRNHGGDPLWQGGARMDLPIGNGLRLSLAAIGSYRDDARSHEFTRGFLSANYTPGGR